MKNHFAVRLNFTFSPFSSQSLWKGFCSTVIFNFFQIIMVSLFIARHGRYLSVSAVYSVNRNYLFSWGKQEKKLLKQSFD